MNDFLMVDTDVLIDVSRHVEKAVTMLDNLSGQYLLACSVVTQMELMVGCRDKSELRSLEHFLERFQIFPITEEISREAVHLLRQYRLSHGLLIAD